MARKLTTAVKSTATARTKDRDKQTLGKIVDLADRVSRSALAGREPKIEIPTRAKSNTKVCFGGQLLSVSQVAALVSRGTLQRAPTMPSWEPG